MSRLSELLALLATGLSHSPGRKWGEGADSPCFRIGLCLEGNARVISRFYLSLSAMNTGVAWSGEDIDGPKGGAPRASAPEMGFVMCLL